MDPLSPLTESDIHDRQLPEDIGKRWKKLAPKLGFNKPAVDAIQSENQSDRERCIDLLVQWMEKEGQQGATAGKLAAGLTSIGLQSLADRLIGMRNKFVVGSGPCTEGFPPSAKK